MARARTISARTRTRSPRSPSASPISDEGDWRASAARRSRVFDRDKPGRRARDRPFRRVAGGDRQGQLYPQFHAQEIYEQPVVVAQTLRSYIRPVEQMVALPDMAFDQSRIERVTIVACGTASYVGMIGKYWIERFARLPVEVDVASEFRYREPDSCRPTRWGSSSASRARPADTLAALRHMRAGGVTTPGSSTCRPARWRARSTCCSRPTPARKSVSPRPRAFTCQLAVMAALSVNLARAKGLLPPIEERTIVRHLIEAPAAINAALAHRRGDRRDGAYDRGRARRALPWPRPRISDGAGGARSSSRRSATSTPKAMLGEMKHGPIALIDDTVPLIVLAPSGPLFDKTVSNMQEAKARGARVVLISDAEGLAAAGDDAMATIEMPSVHPLIRAARLCGCRCNCSPITSRSPRAPTSISRAISPNRDGGIAQRR